MVKNRDRGATPGCLKRFEPLYGMPLADIKRAHVIRILDWIMAEGKPYRANRALASIQRRSYRSSARTALCIGSVIYEA